MDNGQADKWLIVGSSKSVAKCAWVRQPYHRVVTVSKAIVQVPDCDVYIFKDKQSVTVHRKLIAAMIADGRTVVAPMSMLIHNTPNPPPDWWRQVTFIPSNNTTTFVRGEYGDSSLSGVWGIYWAINHGAQEIDIVGFEGAVELQAGIPGGAYVEQARILRNTAKGCPDVRFRYYGELVWEIDGDNVEVIA